MDTYTEVEVEVEVVDLFSDDALEQMVFGLNGCSVGSVPNTCQMQSNKY